MPWVAYEAEDADTNGAVLGPSRAFGEIAAESSGRRSVRLEKAGDYVEFTATEAANAIVVRYVIPDAPGGGGITATLNLYVGGALRPPLTLTSKYSWVYGGEEMTLNAPGAGAHRFFDEARALVGAIPAGAKVRLQKDAQNSAAYYVIDLVDLELVAPPLAQPPNTLSLTADCRAVPDDSRDDTQALQTCINDARARGLGVFIPAGTFDAAIAGPDDRGIAVSNVSIRGAGMWHSTVRGAFARFHCTGSNCRYHDFAILGETVARSMSSTDNGFNGGAGTGSRLENIWVEHTKVGYWVGAGAMNQTNGLVVTGSRFRNLFADGVNFCNGTSNSEVSNSHFRNTGDDALATWAPAAEGGVNTNNVFKFNTVQLPWRANCFGVYGGRDNRVEDNVCADVVTYPGILVAQHFSSHAFSGTTIIQRNTLIRAGGPMFRTEHGALKVLSSQGPISGLVIRDIQIEAPTFSGLHILGPQALQGAVFERITINDPGTFGILVGANASGGATFNAVSVARPATGGLSYLPNANQFAANKGAENSGW